MSKVSTTRCSDRHCIIVDDVRAYRELLKKWFMEWGFTCSLATGAEEAWQEIQSRTIDLVVTDIDMPGISGLELIRAVRDFSGTHCRSVPIIAISSLQDDDIDFIIKQVGAIRFTPKPLEKDHFSRMVATVLRREHSAGESVPVASRKRSAGKVVSRKLRRLLHESRGPRLKANDGQEGEDA